MNKARQRKLEAREHRKESLQAWAQTIEDRIASEKKVKIIERIKAFALEKGISFDEAKKLLQMKKTASLAGKKMNSSGSKETGEGK